ncbi:methyl-accepting chemotaxis protein [Gallaecimonas pentaromativorans]|uniref:methyl-accepting chemotaxis protein n=1 Tax=Gallaecimonas pentaromativorans TaxID=584787 RepID=UPI003A919F56
MQQRRSSLRFKLSLAASLAILLTGIIVMAVSFYSALNAKIASVTGEVRSLTRTYNSYVGNWIDARGRALKSLPAQVSEPDWVKTLGQLRDSVGFDNVFAAYDDGSQQNAGQVTLAPDNKDPRVWGWYKGATSQPGKLFMDNPTVASATGENVVSFGYATRINGQRVVLGADMTMKQILALLSEAQLPGKGFVFIANELGNVFAYQDTQLLNQPVSQLSQGLSLNELNQLDQQTTLAEMTVNGRDSYVYVSRIGDSRLKTVIVIDRDSIIAPIQSALWQQVLLMLLVVAVCLVAFNAFAALLFKPLQVVSAALAKIASGGGDLTQRIHIQSNDEVGQLAGNFNRFMGTLQQLIGGMRSEFGQLRASAHHSEQRADSTAMHLAEQQQEITAVATAIHEMSSATAEIARHAQQTLEAAMDATELADQGRSLVEKNRDSIESLAGSVEDASQVIEQLSEHAKNINSILVTIQGIAEQTNLLALNAAIEAARAGDQGRGFAVVADEVRTLSQRTQSSTGEIQATINTLVASTNQAVTMMGKSTDQAHISVQDASQAAQALVHISEAVQRINTMNTQIATAAEEQSQVTSEITQNTTRIKDVSDTLVSDASGARQQAQGLNAQAGKLEDTIAAFTVA